MNIALLIIYTISFLNLIYSLTKKKEKKFWLELIGAAGSIALIGWAVGWKMI